MPIEQEDVQVLAAAVAAQLSTHLVEQVVAALERVQGRLPAPGEDEPERPVAGTFRREGEYWTLEYAGRLVRLRDSRGLTHLAQLLVRPGQQVHVLELVGSVTPAQRRPPGTTVGCPERGFSTLDAEAKRAYRRRLVELDKDLEEAQRLGDEGRREVVLLEREFLVQELARAVGLHGRDRRTSDPVERARVSVTKAVRGALDTILEHHPALGEHLSRTLRTGTWCCYAAPPSPAWRC